MQTVILSYCGSDFVTFFNEEFTGTYGQIQRKALMKSWVVSRGINVLDKGTGFPDERFGDWGMLKCETEDQYLRCCMAEE